MLADAEHVISKFRVMTITKDGEMRFEAETAVKLTPYTLKGVAV